MNDSPLQTVELHELVEKLQGGDTRARDELIRRTQLQLEHLARKMLHRFPGVHRWEQTADVLQNALVRLLRALQAVRPDSTRGFFALAAEQLRRELLNLAEHYRGPRNFAANHASNALAHGTGDSEGTRGVEPATPLDDLDRWTGFHEAIVTLPDHEREVVQLVFYNGYTQVEIAKLVQIDERTVRRRWQSGCLKLNEMLKGELPEP